MKHVILSVLFFCSAFLLINSCATEPAVPEDGGAEVRSPTATDSSADSTGVSESSSPTPDKDSRESSADDAEPVVPEEVEDIAEAEPEPLTAPTLSVVPPKPRVGEMVTIETDTAASRLVLYDFGNGPVESSTHVYTQFGVKTVTVLATVEEQTAAATIEIVVTGTAEVRPFRTEIQHDSSWRPILPASFTAEGDFDEIGIYENRRELYRIAPPTDYTLPVPFVGTRRFTAALFHRGQKVADVGPVSLTGLNAAPGKPSYDGAQFLTVRAGTEVTFSVISEDPNNDNVRYEIKFAPAGAVFDPETGLFTWTPSTRQRSLFLMNFYAFDIPFSEQSPFVQRGIIVQ